MSLVFFPGVSTTPIVAITDRLTSRSRSQAAQDDHNGRSPLLGNSVVGLWHMVRSRRRCQLASGCGPWGRAARAQAGPIQSERTMAWTVPLAVFSCRAGATQIIC